MTADGERIVRARLAFKLLGFGLGLVFGALLLILLGEPFDMMMGQAYNATSSEAAHTGQSYLKQAWNALPFFILAVGVISLVAGATFESRGPGR